MSIEIHTEGPSTARAASSTTMPGSAIMSSATHVDGAVEPALVVAGDQTACRRR